MLGIDKPKYPIPLIFRWLWAAWRGNRLQAVLNATIGLAGVAVSLAQVWAVQRAIDVASGNVEGSIYWSVAVMAGLILAGFGLSVSAIWVKSILGIRAQNRMQQRLLDRLLRSEWHGKEAMHSGDVLNRLETDVINVVLFLTETVPNTLGVITLFVGAFAYLYTMDRLLAVLIVTIIPLFVGISRLYIFRMRRLTLKVRDSDSKVQSVLQETIQNRMLIKTIEADSIMVGKLENTQLELQNNVVRRTVFSVFSNVILNFGFAFGYLLAFLRAAVRLSANTLSFGGMTAFLQLVNRIQSPAKDLTKLVPAFVKVITSAERLMELEEAPLEEEGRPIALKPLCGLRLKGIGFEYDKADGPVLDGLDYDFKPGSCTAILGETGSGKTTIVRLILALMRPQKGTIELYNGTKSVEVTPRTRCNFVYVPQGNTLMSGTIRDNLRLGKLHATDEEMQNALQRACADFVFELPQGLNTTIDEHGGGLSEGQAQRISIARALLRDRQVMLFDESTSALDADTERQLLHNIITPHDKTILFITHRPAVIEYCDATLQIAKR